MSVSINNLFNYSRSLPVPFDTMTNKKVKVASMYGAKTESTLCGSVIKAVHAMCRCMNGTGEGAVGQIDTNKSVAEYKSSVGPDAYHLVVFDAASGSALASVYDKNTELIEQYVAHPSQRDGAAIFFALMPFLMSDAEFDETFQEYYDQFIAGYPDMAKATESMAILCDNAYRRIKDDTCPAHINITVDKSGNLMRVSQGQLDSGSFVPTSVTAGEFTIFAKTGPAVIKKAGVVVEHTDFVGKYPLTPGRTLSALELSLIPKLPEWYIIPPEVVDICKHAQKTTGRPMQMRNFLLRGPAGTGKTMGAKAIAAGLGLPYMKYTCSANTEIFDFTGMIFPETDAVSTGSSELDREREILKSMGGISYANVAKLLRLPDLDDMDYDPAGVYQALTGVENLAATVQDCMSVVLEKVTEKVQALSKRAENRQSSGQNYTYVETDFVKALKHGYLVEVQEPSTIIQPGVLVGLNSLLEQEGSITLPTGEIIRRHPDTVVIVTTNVSYEGCRQMNQSVVDRMSLVKDIELPEPEVMVQRAMAVTGCADEYLVSQMVQVVNDMADYCRKNSITDGACGMRSLIDWVISAEISGDPYASIKQPTIIQANLFGKLEIISATDVLKDDSFTNESGYVLLTFLLLNRKREHPLRLLTDVIWESTDMGNPYNSIKNVVYRLRKTLACIGLRDLIQASHGTFTLNPNYTIFTDVERFDDACKRIDNSSDPAILQALYESIIGLYRGSLLPRYDFYHWLMPKTLYYQNKFLHYMKRYLSMLYREKNYLRVQELSMDLLSIDMYESEVHYYLIKAMLMSGSKTLSQIYFRQAEPYLTDEHMQEVKTLFTSCRT